VLIIQRFCLGAYINRLIVRCRLEVVEMAKKKIIVTVLLTLGTVIFLAGLFTPLKLGEPHYAFFWALIFWVVGGMIAGFVKEEKKSEEAK
jgi:uncharacterized membrane protein YiaA